MEHTLLLVDDDAAVRRFITRLLGRGGFTVIPCGSVREAVTLVASPDVRFDVVLTDLVLSDGDGAEVASHVARCRPGMTVVYMSGYGLQDLHPLERPPAGAPFLQKPFGRDELIATLTNAGEVAA